MILKLEVNKRQIAFTYYKKYEIRKGIKMEGKIYIVRLDDDKHGWSYLWNHTIREINKIALKIEITTTIVPILAITTVGDDLDLLQRIDGIKSIEENLEGHYLQA